MIQTYLEPLIEKTMCENHIPGFAIGIVENGRVVYARGFGVAELGGSRLVTTQSLFHMASVTKPFVATAIMQLVECGKVNLDERLTDYLPYFCLDDKRSATVTIKQVLGHVAGLPDVEDYHWDNPEYDDGALERYVRSLSNLSSIAAPGEKFEYSNIGFEVLGDVIAKVSGENFESYVEKHIFDPLAMKKSTLLLREADRELLTSPHIPGSQNVIVSEVFPYNRVHAPSSTLYSSVDDMNRWAMANLNRGELEGRQILKASSYDRLWQPQADTTEPGMKVGLSWALTQHNGHSVCSHSGQDDGFQSHIILAPDDAIAIVAMNNFSSDQDHYPSDIANAAMDMLLSERK